MRNIPGAVLGTMLFIGLCLGGFTPARGADALTLPDETLLTDPVFARPGFGHLSAAYVYRTRYLLAIQMDPYRGRLTGRARILFVNNTGAALDRIVLRLYQNHPVHAGRRMAVQSVTLNGAAAAGAYGDSVGTVFSVPLPAALAPGGTATLDIAYTITIPTSSFFYVSEAFPMVAVYDDTGWRTDVATNGLDYVYSESALFAVRLTAPSEVGTWFVGAVKTAQQNDDGTTTYTIVTGPVRNFIVAQVRGWGVLDVSGGPVPIRLLYSGNQAVAQEIADITVAAMNYFDQTFGPYPYAEFDVIVMRFPSGGEEYPGLVFVNNERNSVYRRFITAHEVAHQWFYGIAGNDTLRHAWLDESLVQIAGYLFYKQTRYGSPNADEEFWSHILTWYNRIQGTPRPIDTPLDQFRDFADYMSTTYGGGAVFMRDLGQQIGDAALIAGLRAYVQAVYLGVGTPRQFFDAIQAQTPLDLRPLFCQRVGIMC